MANEQSSVFNAEQSSVIARLASCLAILGPLLIALGAVRLGLAAVDVWKGSIGAGIAIAPQGLLLIFAGLAFWTGSADAKFLHDVKGREKEHFAHTLKSFHAAFVALSILGGYVAFLAFLGLWM